MFETTKTVREYALEIPTATRIFEKLGIDYCCGGGNEEFPEGIDANVRDGKRRSDGRA